MYACGGGAGSGSRTWAAAVRREITVTGRCITALRFISCGAQTGAMIMIMMMVNGILFFSIPDLFSGS